MVFEEGITVADGQVTGDGRKYDLTLATSARVSSIALDDVAAMESYQKPVQTGETVAGNVLAAPIVGAGGLFLAAALFGSCPTTYSLADGAPVLEAESFSYSIAPTCEP